MVNAAMGCELPLSSERAVVAIKSISRWEFNQFLPKHFFVESVLGEQVAWWANETGGIIGAIARKAREPAWSFILLKRGSDGQFRACKLRSGIRNRVVASAQLLHAMEMIQQSALHGAASTRMER